MPEYSVVIPVFNEEDSLEILFTEITTQMRLLGSSFELIFVDDCSFDHSFSIMENFKSGSPVPVHVVRLNKRSGQTCALKNGLERATGNVIITLDADLQNDPVDIPRLISRLKEGYDMVCGWRKSREDKPLKKYLSKLGNIFQRRISGLKIHDVSCTLRACYRHCLPSIDLEWEGQHRFIPLSLFLKGYKITEVLTHHHRRKFGYSKYGHQRIGKVIIDFLRILSPARRKA